LSAESAAFYRKIAGGWELGDDGLAILSVACQALDRLHEAQALLRRDGLTIAGTRGPKPHPAVAVERESRAAFLAALRQLNLDGAGGDAPRSR
jgi:hypothetical protein